MAPGSQCSPYTRYLEDDGKNYKQVTTFIMRLTLTLTLIKSDRGGVISLVYGCVMVYIFHAKKPL